MIGQIWYRYDAAYYTVDCDLEGLRNVKMTAQLSLTEYPVEKVTARGVRLAYGRLVLHAWRKKFASPTKEEALTAFVARKRRQVAILRARLSEAEAALAAADGKTPDCIPRGECFEDLV